MFLPVTVTMTVLIVVSTTLELGIARLSKTYIDSTLSWCNNKDPYDHRVVRVGLDISSTQNAF